MANDIVDDAAAVSPPVAAAQIWLRVGNKATPRPAEVCRFVATAIPDKFTKKYAERFFVVEVRGGFPYEPPKISSGRARDECILTIESYLRRFALRDQGLDPKSVTLAFRDSPKYEQSLEWVARFNDYLEALIHVPVWSCSTCNLVGQVDNWFGWNRGLQPPVPQSRCRCCQTPGALVRIEEESSATQIKNSKFENEPRSQGKVRTYRAEQLNPLWDTKTKSCPRCGFAASGRSEILRYFGARTLLGEVLPQSWCRRCRAPELVEQ